MKTIESLKPPIFVNNMEVQKSANCSIKPQTMVPIQTPATYSRVLSRTKHLFRGFRIDRGLENYLSICNGYDLRRHRKCRDDLGFSSRESDHDNLYC